MSSSSPPSSSAQRNLRVPVERDGKKLPKSSTIEFLLMVFVGLPFWAFVLLPAVFVYQVFWKALVCHFILRRNSSSSSSSGLKSTIPTPGVIRPRDDRPFDIIVLGATGFTGTMAVEYLLRQYFGKNSKQNIRFAIAGRSVSKLEGLQTRLLRELSKEHQQANSTEEKIEIMEVDTTIPAHVMAMVQRTKVVINFVGPFHIHGGTTVMEACAKHGTHYIDITGEIDWVKEMLAWSPNNDGVTLDDIAHITGAKLINCCGNDCVPWDLTVFKVHELLKQHSPNEDLVDVQCWDEFYSSPSGGTAATIVATVKSKDLITVHREMQAAAESDPFVKLHSGTKSSAKFKETSPLWIGKIPKDASISLATRYPVTAPFVMAPVNAQIVKRSHILRSGEEPPKEALRYNEAAVHPDFATAFCTMFKLVLGFSVLLLSGIPPLDNILQEVMVKAGEGPSPEAQAKHYLYLLARGTGSQGTVVETALYYRNDPGYRDTARMAVESGLSLVVPESVAKIPSAHTGGFWTPSTGLGNALLDRLVDTGCIFDSQIISKRST